MKEQKENQRISKLEQLTEEQQTWIVETALHAQLVDVVLALRKEGIHTSPASLSRFIRKDREKRLLEDRKEINGAANAFAESGREGKLREGTLEAVRQRMYERAVVSQSPEEAERLFAALVKEEAKLKEVELEARKVAALEQQVKLQALRIEVDMAKAKERGLKKAEVVESAPIAAGELTNGNGHASNTGADEEKKRLVLVLREVNEIVNRGGPPEEKVLELRGRLGEEVRLLGADAE
jgi:uncharacterized protein with von Willebrand factor type A (vWA) domain